MMKTYVIPPWTVGEVARTIIICAFLSVVIVVCVGLAGVKKLYEVLA